MAKKTPRKLTDLRIPPILVVLSMAIIMTIAVLSTLIVQEYIKQRTLIALLDISPTTAPTVVHFSNDTQQELTTPLNRETTDNASENFANISMKDSTRTRTHKNSTTT